MASWRRERNGGRVHIVTDSVPVTLCGVDRADAPISLWDPGEAARQICDACRSRLATQLALAESTLGLALAKRDLVPSHEYTGICEDAKRELRELARLFPAGQLSDNLTHARACIVRDDPDDAHAAVLRWREVLRAIGLIV